MVTKKGCWYEVIGSVWQMQHLLYLYFEMPQANISKSDVPGAIIGGLIGGAVGAWGGDYYGEQAAKAIIK